jgi:hypothetical protein
VVKRFLFSVFLIFFMAFSASALDVSDEITQAYIRFDGGPWQSVHSNLAADLLTYDSTYQISSSIDILIPVTVPADSITARFDFLTKGASFGAFSVDYGTFYDSKYNPRSDSLKYTFVSANRLDYSGGSHLFSRSVQVFCSSMSNSNVYWFVGFHWSGSNVTLVTTQSIGSIVGSASSSDPISLSGDWASLPESSSFSGSSPITLDPAGNGLVKSDAVGGISLSPSRASSSVSVSPSFTGTVNSTTKIFQQKDDYFYLTPIGVNLAKADYVGLISNSKYSGSAPSYASYVPYYSGNIDMAGTLPNYDNSATVSGNSPDYSFSGSFQNANSVYPFSFSASRASDDSEAVAQLKRANTTLDGMASNLQTITDDYTARENAGTEIGGSATSKDISSGTSGISTGFSSLKSGISGLTSFATISAPAAGYISFLTLPIAAIFNFGNGYLLYIATAMVLLSVIFFIIRRMGGGSD